MVAKSVATSCLISVFLLPWFSVRVTARSYKTASSHSKGSKSHPCAKFIRFTKEENDKMVKLCRKRGLTIQSFGHAAVMRALNEAELGRKADGEIERDERPVEMPLGLGIRDRLRESREEDEGAHGSGVLFQPIDCSRAYAGRGGAACG